MASTSELIANLNAAVTEVENRLRSTPVTDPSSEVIELQNAMELATERLLRAMLP